MVSKAREDLPEPESPVITVRRSRGISTLTFLRLCWRAPRTVIRSIAIVKNLPAATVHDLRERRNDDFTGRATLAQASPRGAKISCLCARKTETCGVPP